MLRTKITDKLPINRRMIIFLFTLFILGIMSGALFIIILKNSDKTLVKEYLEKFFSQVSTKPDLSSNIITELLVNIGLVFIIWLLGMSIVGLPIIIFIYFYKIFIIGFSIGSILINYKFKGLLMAFIYVFPHQAINIIIYMILTMYALSFSIKFLNCILRKKKIDFKNIMGKYYLVLVISISFILLSTLYEIYIMPFVLNFILKLI